MKEIYASASSVIVWLGAATPATDIAMDMFNACEENGASLNMTASHTYRVYDKQRQDLVERSQQFKEFIESDGIPSFFMAVQHLMIREWWYRTWVLQEFCVGREVTLACGSKKLGLALFDKVSMTFDTVDNVSSAHFLHTAEQWLTASDQDKPKRLSEKAGTRDVKHAIDFLRLRLYHQRSLEEKKRSLLDLVVTFYVNVRPRAILRSTDPRDKIYGLLAIASDAEQLKIVPDYLKSIEEVYTEAATRILSLGKLELLQFVHPQNPKLPSWVPDWEQPLRHITPYECRELDKPFSADATMPAFQPSRIPGDSSVLECHGCIVDSVSSFSDFLSDEMTKALLAVAEMPCNTQTRGKLDALITLYVHFSQIKQLCQLSAQIIPSLYGPSNTWLNEALWRIPVADQEVIDAHFTHFQRATSESERRYNGLLKIIEAFESLGARMKEPDRRTLLTFFEKNFAPIIQRNSIFDALYLPAVGKTVFRKPYLTQKGYVGLGHESMRIGDLVCILQGGPVQFLLRRTERGEYILVSDTYVHGIMDGDFMNTKPYLEVFRLK